MAKSWNDSGPITAWTDHDGPGTIRRAPRGLPWTLAFGWIAIIVVGVAWGCPCAETGTCPSSPLWAIVANIAFPLVLSAALIGLFRRNTIGAVLSAVAAVVALPIAADEYGHAAWWGILLASTAAVFLVWSGLVLESLKRYHREVAFQQADPPTAVPVGAPEIAAPVEQPVREPVRDA